MHKARTIVFGGTGFIGGAVARTLLARDENVAVFRRPSPHVLRDPIKLLGLERADLVDGDLNDFESVKAGLVGRERAVFAAGYYPIGSLNADTQIAVAKRQLQNFLDALAAVANDAAVVFVSSIATIGRPEPGRLADELTPFDQRFLKSAYYRIKYELEQMVLEAARSRAGKTVIVNPSGVFGDRDIKPTTGRVIVDGAKGRLAFRLAGQMNAVDVNDVANGIVAALERGRSGERYILGGDNITINHFLEMICEIVGVPKPMIPIPLAAVRALAVASEHIHAWLKYGGAPLLPLVGVDLMENAIIVSSAKANRELGYTSAPIRPALERAYRWLSEQGYLK